MLPQSLAPSNSFDNIAKRETHSYVVTRLGKTAASCVHTCQHCRNSATTAASMFPVSKSSQVDGIPNKRDSSNPLDIEPLTTSRVVSGNSRIIENSSSSECQAIGSSVIIDEQDIDSHTSAVECDEFLSMDAVTGGSAAQAGAPLSALPRAPPSLFFLFRFEWTSNPLRILKPR